MRPCCVETGAEAQRFAPGVLAVDLVALDAADLEAEAVRPEVDDGESGGGHEAKRCLSASRRSLAETPRDERAGARFGALIVSATLDALSHAALLDAGRLPTEDPHREGLRRRDRVASRPGADAVASASATACCSSARTSSRVFSFKLRGAYNKMAHLSARRARARRRRRVGGQSRAGCRAGGAAARLQGDHRHAGDHAVDQDCRGRGARGEGRAARRLVQRRLRARAVAAEDKRSDLRSSVRRSRTSSPGRERSRWKSCASAQGPIDAIFVAIGGGGLDFRHRVVRQASATGDPGHRRAAGRFRRDGALACRGPAGEARPRRVVRRRRRGQAGRQGDVSHLSRTGRRHRARRHRRDLRRVQGRVRGHARGARAGRRAVGGRASRRGASAIARRTAPTSPSPAAPT